MDDELVEKNSQVVKLQEDMETLIQSSAQLQAIDKILEAQNEKLIQDQKVKLNYYLNQNTPDVKKSGQELKKPG